MSEQPVDYRVDRWFDRRTRQWVVELRYANGDLVHEAEYYLTEREAKGAQRNFRAVLLPQNHRVELTKSQPKYA